MSGASAYFLTPEAYDRVFSDFHTDIPVFLEEAHAAGDPVLEVCCGNGRLLVPIREAGVDIDGLDLHETMLEALRRKLGARGLTGGVHRGDMRDFSLPRRYALVFIGFNSFAHNLTQVDQLRTLTTCRAHLAPGGRFVMSLFHPNLKRLANHAAPWVSDAHDLPDGTRMTIVEAMTTDRVEQRSDVSGTFQRHDRDGRLVEAGDYAFQTRYVWKPEMELLLRLAGFTRWEVSSRIRGHRRETYPEPHPPEDGGILHWRAWAD